MGSFCNNLLPCQSSHDKSDAHLAEAVLQRAGKVHSSQGFCITEVTQLTFCSEILCLYSLHFFTLPLVCFSYFIVLGTVCVLEGRAEMQNLALVLRRIGLVGRYRGPPRWLGGEESVCQCRRLRRCGFDPWVRKIPWRRKWQPTSVSLPKKSHGQRSLAGYSP